MKKGLYAMLVFLWCGTGCSQNPLPSNLKPLNIDFKNRGYFYASCEQIEQTAGLGGWADSGNMYQKIDRPGRFEQRKLIIAVDTSEPAAFAEKYLGHTLYVANTLFHTIFFDAQDSRLEMKLQALDKNGEWKDIEYLPSSWCGNSYHMVYLPGHHYWKFTVPAYEGKFKTRLRAVLSYKTATESGERLAYSNEFEGSVNDGQFTKLPNYKPGGIMDPYNN